MDPILVLGSKVRKYSTHSTTARPGAVLESRLEKARQLAEGNDALIVVSGKGECQAMGLWLVEHGVDPVRIMLEYEATSTNENLEKSQALFPQVGHWNVVTSDFHVFRTRVWAWHLGISITCHPAVTRPPYRAKNMVREAGALAHSTARVVWRKLVS